MPLSPRCGFIAAFHPARPACTDRESFSFRSRRCQIAFGGCMQRARGSATMCTDQNIPHSWPDRIASTHQAAPPPQKVWPAGNPRHHESCWPALGTDMEACWARTRSCPTSMALRLDTSTCKWSELTSQRSHPTLCIWSGPSCAAPCSHSNSE